ncbi:Flavin-containing monooxygenase FMO GS-OX5 [Grifola frondosa]|uniref:Flavin-containing monooxygenase FMO GS-OX5 n=1 Tax=Grifola frondosa TaxID=5627 RepID=A0A1C7LV61_GRIFR|nr:Flavin-containing monooxygenase FMO GS-OX5 [Grifola frondosa]
MQRQASNNIRAQLALRNLKTTEWTHCPVHKTSHAAAGGAKQICIIGAGPTGLAALRVITDTPQYKEGLWEVTAFEARDKIGGIWVPAPPTGDPPWTSLYDSLTTNVPHPAMAARSFPFPPSTPLFPPAATVEAYLDAFAETFGLLPHIRLNAPVLSATWDDADSKWVVCVPDDETHRFDLVLVANGHYRVPRFPDTAGLDAWRAKQKATHSACGDDIFAGMRPFTRTIIRSVVNATAEDHQDGTLKVRGRVKEYLDADEGRVLFEDGIVETGIDYVFLATGYQYSFPFFPQSVMRTSAPPSTTPLPEGLFNSTHHVFPLARHMFPLTSPFPPSSLAFIGLPLRAAPFALAEAQTRVALKAFADPTSLDVPREAAAIVARYEALRAAAGGNAGAIAERWHHFDGCGQLDYRDELNAFLGGEFAESEWKVPEWEKEVQVWKMEMKGEWKELERAGEAEEWVRGVGAGSDAEQEWVDVMVKLLRRTKNRKIEHGGCE